MTRRISILLLVAALSACSRSQPPAVAGRGDPLFANGGFESGTLDPSWTVTVLWNNGITYPPQSYGDLRLQSCAGRTPGGIPDCANHTSVKGPASAESQQLAGLSGLVAPRWPRFGSYTAVVNEQGYHQSVNSLKQSFTTTAADVDPADGKIHCRFALTPQLQDPGHSVTQQPYFYVVLRNLTKGTTLYQTFNYSNEPGVPWQRYAAATPVLYTDWQVFDVAPGNAALWVGDTIEIEVVAAGCSPSGHWGQVYVDGFGAQLPSLSISGTAPQWVAANADLTYTFQAENATSLVVRDAVATEVLPANTTFVSVTAPPGVTCTAPPVGSAGTGVSGGPSVVCALGWMNPSASATFQVKVHTNAGLAFNTPITNGNYFVQGDGINPLLGGKIVTTIGNGPYADLGVTVTDGQPAVVQGGPVSYTITASNSGPTAATNASVVDTFPAALTGVAWTCTGAGGGTCSRASGTGNIAAGNGASVTLPVGATVTFAVTATVDPATSATILANTVTISPPGGITDSSSANNADTDLDAIGFVHLLTVTKDLGETGQGQVVSSPMAISCGTSCASQSANFLDGSPITLTAIARQGDQFDHWSGGCVGTANVCTVTLSGAPLEVVAHFRGPTVTGTVAAGSGTVSCVPSPAVQRTSSTCTLAPAGGWQLTALTDDGVNVIGSVAGGAYTLSGSGLVSDHAVVATFMKSNATACGAGTECASGVCFDGVCCNQACGGQCQACIVPGHEGTCSPVTGAPLGFRAACTSDGTECGGACDGTNVGACAYPGSGTSCRSASCTGGVATLAASCAGTGSCPPLQTRVCAPFVCGDTACLTSCAVDADCIVGDWCSGGACVPKRVNGSACTGANQCTSGFCADGTCCGTACGGQCEACNVGGHLGQCTAVTGAPVGGRPACANDGSGCGGACNGTITAACTYPGASTSCRAASCAGGTGVLPAGCNGAGGCPTLQTQACAPFVCGETACLTSCDGDAQCVTADYCSGGACVPKLPNGEACTLANQCTSGSCVDGYCCDGGCSGTCEACNVAGHLGACWPVTGAPVGTRTACASDGSACGGSCDGTTRSACTYPGASTSCRAASCAGGTATAAAACDGGGHCPAPSTQACAPYVCDATACFATCSADGQCAAGSWCSGTSCVPQLANGQACTGSNQCANGHCVDGVCCESACDGQCEACNVSGDGTCTAVTGAPAGLRPACATDGTLCGGACDGTRRNVCTYPSDTTSCRAPGCSDGTATLAAACDGAGRCPDRQTQACAPYACGATACLGTCSSESDCAAGEWCAGGVCTDRHVAGHACGADVQCASGHCADGVCCDAKCDGQCEACNLSGSEGTCSPVTGAPAGARQACTSDGSACGGACDGVHRTACGYPQGSVSCRDPSCADGVATLGATCNGTGRCPGTQTQPCAPYACGATACANGCSLDADCAAGTWCSAGVCAGLLADGQTCSGSNQCLHGHCVDGVCCDAACGGQCEACNLPGALLGTCSPVVGAPANGRAPCASDGSACGGACDGADRTACAYPGAAVECRAASCAIGVATLTAACDGAGSCPSPQQQSCTPNVCGATACASGCTDDAGCAAGYWCSAGVCTARLANGTACSGASQCTSGICVDGVCCDGACSGKCEACDVAGHVGACTPVTGAPHGGARGTCASDGTACGGSCDGANRTACGFPGTGTVCRAPTCSGGAATGAATCDGAGACGATPAAVACGGYACAGDACATACTTSADCASGHVCEAGACLSAGAAAGAWKVAGSGGCSATGGGSLGALAALALLLAPAAVRRRRRSAAAALLAVALALPGAARAQSTSFDAQRFQPLGGARDILAVPTASLPGHLDVRAGAYLDYASRPLRLTGPRDLTLVDSQTDLTLTGSVGLLDRFEVSAAFPVVAHIDGRPASDASATFPARRPHEGIGDLRVTPRARLLELGPLRLAAAMPVTLPTGSSAYGGQSGVTASPLAVAEWGDARGVRVAANVGAALRRRERLANLDQGSAFAFGAGGEVPFRVAGVRLAGLATLSGELGGGAVERPVELLGAIRWLGSRGIEVTVGGGRGLTQGYGMPRYRLLAAVDLSRVALRRAERAPAAAAAPAPAPGAPPAPVVAAVVEPAPEPAAAPTTAVAEVTPVDPCAATTTHRPEQCPDLDDDADGIPNGRDRCPLVAGTAEHEGCPPPKAVLTGKKIEIMEAVFFDSAKDVIQERSFPLLDDVARILAEHPEVKALSIEGHTDASGDARANQRLSERRAAAVKVYLVRKGIDAGRLATRGFGPSRPVVKEVDAAAKAKNRRVEFLVE